MIKSAGSFFMPPVFAAVDPLILFPTPPLIEPLTSDCSFKNVGEGSWPPDVVQMYIKKSGLVKFEILLIRSKLRYDIICVSISRCFTFWSWTWWHWLWHMLLLK